MTFLKDLLFPKLCLGCGALGCYICINCQKKLYFIEQDYCIYCRGKSYMGLTHPGCHRKNGLDGAIGFYLYGGLIQKIIKQTKYRLAREVWEEFCQIIQPKIQNKLLFYKQLLQNGFLHPVPLHSKKLRLRGFNQATLVGEFFNKSLELPLIECFKRIKETQAQAELKRKKDRYLNTKAAFKPQDEVNIQNKTVIIADDVITTGYTILDFARALKQQGAKTVYALALAKG